VCGFEKVTDGPHSGSTILHVLVDAKGELTLDDEVAIFVPPNRLTGGRIGHD
jgi:hypothetical protein